MAFRIVAALAVLESAAAGTASFRGPASMSQHQSAPEEIETWMRPLFQALPQNDFGGLDSGEVRYLLYRYFLQQRGWLMHEFEPEEGVGFPEGAIRSDPVTAEKWLQKVHSSRGLALGEIASLAILLEDQVQQDGSDRLAAVWSSQGLQRESLVDASTLKDILEMHTLTYVEPAILKNLPALGGPAVKEAQASYPSWPRTQGFLRDIWLGATAQRDQFTYEDAQAVTREAVKRFGHWQDDECVALKEQLSSMESSRPGHVDLLDFYEVGAQRDGWLFVETKEYLRLIGAVDETDENMPSVLIANYVGGPANILGEGRGFHLACPDFCQDIMAQIEASVRAPEATVQQLLDVVSALASPSEEAVRDLQDIAASQGSKVQLHSSLFARWLHHQFPRDCALPHEPGSTQLLSPSEYEESTGRATQEVDAHLDILVKELEKRRAGPSASKETRHAAIASALVARRQRGSVAAHARATRNMSDLFVLLAAASLVSFAVGLGVACLPKQRPETSTSLGVLVEVGETPASATHAVANS